MKCDQTEPKLNALLDNGRAVSSDVTLMNHLLECPRCAQLADAFVAIDSFGAMTAGPGINVAARVLATVATRPIKQRLTHVPANSLRWLPHWATAAAVLVAATVTSLYSDDDTNTIKPQQGNSPQVVAVEPIPSISTPVLSTASFDRRIFRTTGHSIATFPLVVMGRDSGSTDDGVSDQTERQPINERWQQWWPVDDSDTPAPSGETGWTAPAQIALIA